jgi:general secretion pathway protein G
MKRHSSKRNAFTLLEIMLVVTIIAMILGAAMVAFKGKLEFAQGTRASADIQSISSSFLVYQAKNGFLPTTEQGLQALVTRPDTDPRPRQWTQQLPKIPIDPWGNEYHYVRPGTHNTDGYDLFSAGPDGIPGNGDDIGNWEATESK